MTSSDEYLELRYMNNTKTVQEANITNERMFPIINAENHYTMSVVRFDASNSKVPMYVPEIKPPNNDLAYDENGNLRNIFDYQPVVLKPYNNNENIQQGGVFELYGDYVAIVSTSYRHKQRYPDSFTETTTDNTVTNNMVGVWNRHTGNCLWAVDFADYTISTASISGGGSYTASFFCLNGCSFSNDGSNLIVFLTYKLFSGATENGRFMITKTFPTTTGYSASTVISPTTFGVPYDLSNSKIMTNQYKYTSDFLFVASTAYLQIYNYPAMTYFTHFNTPYGGNTKVDAVSYGANKIMVMANGTGTGSINVYQHNGTTFAQIGTYSVGDEILMVSLSPDGNHIIVVSYVYLQKRQTITILNKQCTTVYKSFDFHSLGYVSNVSWKPVDNLTTTATTSQLDKYRVIYTVQLHSAGIDQPKLDQIKVYNYKFSSDTWNSASLIHEELFTDTKSKLLVCSKMTSDGEELLVSQLDPTTIYGDQSTIKQSVVKLIREEYDTIPSVWKAETTTNKSETNTNLQMLLEHHFIPTNNNSKKTANTAYIKWKNEDYDLVGYGTKSQYQTSDFTKQQVLEDEFFHCYNLEHFAKLFDECLKTIFRPFNETFESQISCIVYEKKLLILFPPNAFNYNFRIVINQELNRILGFHTVPHETIPNAYVFVIKRGVIQKAGDKWALGENFRPSSMFPFKSILFTSNDLKVRPLRRYNSNHNEDRQRSSIITDLLLTVDSPSDFYDVMVHTPETSDRKINLDNGEPIKNVKISVLLETADGYQVPLKLNCLKSCGILLKINSA